jgi:hypothetical protein
VPDISFGALENNASYVANPRSDGIALPVGRPMQGGSQACAITAIGAYVTGNGGAASGRLYLGNAYTPVFTVGAGAGQFTGLIGVEGGWLVQGGTTRITASFGSSLMRFYRGGGGSVQGDGGFSRTGTLAGVYRYAMGPGTPRTLPATQVGPTTAMTNFTMEEDDGGSPVTSYVLQISRVWDFSSDVFQMEVGTGQNRLTDLVPGTYYYYRVAARNGVTAMNGGTAGLWSATTSFRTLSGAYVGNGSSFSPVQVFAGDGTNWNPTSVFVGDGTNWNPAQ